MEKATIEKEAFFRELEELDQEDITSNDIAHTVAVLRKNRPTPQKSHNSNTSHISYPLEVKASNYQQYRARDPQNDHIAKMPVRAKEKNRKEQQVELLPESQQTFKDWKFYYIPNDDVSPDRESQTRKAEERGAVRVREWRNYITHVIVDDRMDYNEATEWLKNTLNRSISDWMIVVNDYYLEDCIMYNVVLVPNKSQYRVRGYQQVDTADPASAAAHAKSLPCNSEEGPSRLVERNPSLVGSDDEASTDQSSGSCRSLSPSLVAATRKPSHPSNQAPNALDEAIKEIITGKDLSDDLDDDDDIVNSTASGAQDSKSDKDLLDDHYDSEKELNKPAKKKRPGSNSWQANFSWMTSHTDSESKDKPNARTIELLQKIADHYETIKDPWRPIAYRRAISALKKQDQKVTTREEALAIPSIGESLAKDIEEIVQTDRLRRLDNVIFDSRDAALQMFLKIYGVGFPLASRWTALGYRTLDDLKVKAQLTKNQRVGVEHYDDLNTRIPRDEVARHGKIVRDAAFSIDKAIEIIIGGSYRRGADNSGDIDFLITKPDCSVDSLRVLIFDTLITQLWISQYIKADLAVSTKKGGSIWHGCACLPGSHVWRRVDFLLVPQEEMGAALIYFTGNDIFNRSMRLLARRKGMRLNQHGLWRDVIRGINGERVTQGSLAESRSERRIFELLEVPWKPPHERIC